MTLFRAIPLLLLLVATAAGAQNRFPEFARALSLNLGLQGRVMWIDCTANIDRIMTREGVQDIVARCKKANLTTLVVDVKPVSGQVVYNSRIAERLRSWRGKEYPEFDVLAAFVEEGHKAGLEVAASFNVFSEGHKYYNVGLAYRKPEWQSVTYIVERSLVSREGKRLPIRAVGEPEDPSRTLVYGDDYVQEATGRPGEQLTVALDGEARVVGIVDPALLGDEPLSAPEEGYLFTARNSAHQWVAENLRAGDMTRFEAVGSRVKVTEAPSERVAAFVNPLHPEVRQYEISLIREVVENYDVDAVVFDRMRWANLNNDYSDLTRQAFQRWLGKPINRWPEDVVRFDPAPGAPLRRGPYFKPWLEFRSRVIREFVRETTETLRKIKPNIQFGTYVGSWFTEYYPSGANWGSEKFPVRTWWATPTYNEAGYAEFLDWMATGCYQAIATRAEARALRKSEGATVEAAADLSTMAVANSIPVYAGLYVLDYQNRPEAFLRALEAARSNSHGVMIFDLVYIYQYDWWNLLEQAFAQPAIPPHRVPGLTAQWRTVQDTIRSRQDAGGSRVRMPVVPAVPGGG